MEYRIVRNAYGKYVPKFWHEYRWPFRWLNDWEPLHGDDGPFCDSKEEAQKVIED